MEARELRIGNIVEYDGLPCKVKMIEESGLEVLFEDGEDIWIDIWQFCPISITEDWLLKFGFDKRNERFYKFIYMIEPGLSHIFDNGMSFRITINNTESVHVCHVKYIHELQNTYFVCEKKELTND